MPIRKIIGSDVEYYLLVFNEFGRERRDSNDIFVSEIVRQQIAKSKTPVTDVFFMSHGWKGDVPAAIEQYDKWIAAVVTLQSDRAEVHQGKPSFAPLIVGLHWHRSGYV
jgi:hypothetical protein